MKIAVIGTGYVGLITCLGLAEVGHVVIGVDSNTDKIQRLQSGDPILFESGAEESLGSCLSKNTLSFTNDLVTTVIASEVIFLCLPTPQDEDGHADLRYVLSVCHDIFANIQDGIPRTLVLKSTVPVKTNAVITALNNQYNASFSLVSNPEFLKQGTALADFRNPERIVIGARKQEDFDRMREVYNSFLKQAIYLEFEPESVELIKYASNSFLATKISFMNELAALCEKVGADITEIKTGMGTDSRIGEQFLDAGIGYGGSCFPKDVMALYSTGQQHGIHLKILDAAHQVNKLTKQRFIHKIEQYFEDSQLPKVLGVLGLSFKPHTDDIRESAPLEIVRELLNHGFTIHAYDPQAQTHVQLLGWAQLYLEKDIESVLRASSALAILTDWPDFFNEQSYILFNNYIRILFDGRNCIDSDKLLNVRIIGVGRGKHSLNTELTNITKIPMPNITKLP